MILEVIPFLGLFNKEYRVPPRPKELGSVPEDAYIYILFIGCTRSPNKQTCIGYKGNPLNAIQAKLYRKPNQQISNFFLHLTD